MCEHWFATHGAPIYCSTTTPRKPNNTCRQITTKALKALITRITLETPIKASMRTRASRRAKSELEVLPPEFTIIPHTTTAQCSKSPHLTSSQSSNYSRINITRSLHCHTSPFLSMSPSYHTLSTQHPAHQIILGLANSLRNNEVT
jgi:hypothetical protein